MSTNSFFPAYLKSGIYMISCIPLEKTYIGVSNSVKPRLNAHKNSLKNGYHFCRELQKDFIKYGIENFLFQKLLIGAGLEKAELEILETTILLTLPPEKRYNKYTNWRKRPNELNPFYGKTHTKKAREEQSIANKGKPSSFKGSKHTNQVKELISQQNSGTSTKERRKPLYIDSIYYESISEASEKTGLARRLIRERCHSKANRFQNYQWANKNI
jgi:group I intron endonuclease